MISRSEGSPFSPSSTGDVAASKEADSKETSLFEDVSSADVLPSVSTSGEKIRRPSKGEERVALRGKERDTPFFIRKMEIPKDENTIMRFFRSLLWVKVSQGDQKIYLNIGSVAKRYCMTRSEVSNLASEGKLVETLKERVTTLRPLSQIPKDAPITSSEREQVAIQLLAKKTFAEPAITPSLLVNLSKEGKLSVYRLEGAKLIGQGSFGKVYVVSDVANTNGIRMAMKVGMGILREAANLRLIQERGIKAQEPPEYVGKLPASEDDLGINTEEREFMIGDLFTAPKLIRPDLDAWIIQSDASKDKSQQKDLIKQVMGQYKQLAKSGLYHGDLKPQNILLSEKNGKYRVKFGDWGTLKDLNNLSGNMTYTPPYLPKKMGDAIKNGSSIAAKCHDRFSIGCTLHQMLTGGTFPYQWDRQGDPIEPFYEKPLDEAGASPNMKALIKLMTSMEIPTSEAEFQEQQNTIDALMKEIENE